MKNILYKKYLNINNNNLNVKYLVKNIINILKLYIPFYIHIHNLEIYLNKIYYLIIFNNNFFINIYLEFLYHNRITKTINKVKFLIYKLPLITNKNTLIINNLERFFINRLSNKFSIFFNKFVKKNNVIYYCKIFIKNNNIIIIKLNENDILIVKINGFSVNLIYLLNLIGVSNFYIIYNSINYKNIIIKNILNSNIKNNIDIIKIFYNLINIKLINIILNVINNLINIKYKKYKFFNVDHFNNRYIETYKNFLQENIILGLDRTINKLKYKNNIKYIKTLKNTIKENIIINPLSQVIFYNTYMNLFYIDKLNKISLIGPGNIVFKNNNMYNIKLKDINFSQLGNICFIDTYENLKSGLFLTLTTKNYISSNNTIKYELINIKNKLKPKLLYLNSNDIEKYKISLEIPFYKKNKLFNKKYKFISFYKNEFYISKLKNNFYMKNFSDIFSFNISLIPFINFNDPLRLLMGSKMLNQSLMLIFNEFPLVSSHYSNFNNKYNFYNNIISLNEGVVIKISNLLIKIKTINGNIIKYFINNNLYNNYKLKVWEGERVLAGDILAYNNNLSYNNENLYGKNILITYNYFKGYEFEDAFIINKNLINNYIFSSLIFNTYHIKLLKTNNTVEYTTFNTPKHSKNIKKKLNKYGIIEKNSFILNNDLIIGKVLIKNNNKKSLLNNFFGINFNNLIDKSIFLKNLNGYNRIVKLKFYKNFNDNNFLHINLIINSILNIKIGDKLSGRYGNKGVVSLIINQIELPYTSKGYIPDLIVNPLSIPSRMNIGQIYEGILGLISMFKNKIFLINLNYLISFKFIKIIIYNYYSILKYINILNLNNKLKDGQNGTYLLNKNIILVSYFLKLVHVSSDKLNSRGVENKYYYITQQPFKGKKFKGGQRFGEMELWALNSYRGVYNINELLNFKSDNLNYRYNLTDNLKNLKFYFSESYISMLKQLNSLFINIKFVNNFYEKLKK